MDESVIRKHLETIMDLGEEIASWGNFFIVGDEASKEAVMETQIFLISILEYDVGNVEMHF